MRARTSKKWRISLSSQCLRWFHPRQGRIPVPRQEESSNLSTRPQHETDDLGHRFIEFPGNLLIEFDPAQGFDQHWIGLDGDAVLLGNLEDLLGNHAAPFGHDD